MANQHGYLIDMKRRTLIAALAAVTLNTGLSLPALAQVNPVIDALNSYLNALTQVQARFHQESADGTQISGTFFLLKPGKMRFEYDAPADSLVIADGTTLAVFDGKSNAGPQRYPQRQTPLSLLSMRQIDVTSSQFVRRIDLIDSRALITLYDPEAPQNGQMLMIFDTAPMALREWILTDQSGLETHVFLDDLQENAPFERRIFNIAHNIALLQRRN